METVKSLSDLLVGIAPGTWVAISEEHDSVISTGESLEAILGAAREKGVDHPFIFRVPDNDTLLIL